MTGFLAGLIFVACAPNCQSCSIKGAGKCDRCDNGYYRSDDFTRCQGKF